MTILFSVSHFNHLICQATLSSSVITTKTTPQTSLLPLPSTGRHRAAGRCAAKMPSGIFGPRAWTSVVPEMLLSRSGSSRRGR